MAAISAALAALTALERRYDGPIPEPIRQIALQGSATRVLRIEAAGQADFFGALIRRQLDAIRRARRGGGVPPCLLDDLALYRRRRRWWRREADRLRRAEISTPSAAGAP